VLLVGAAVLVALFMIEAVAGPAVLALSSSAIGPNQAFVGAVNGRTPKAVIFVVCPGPSGVTGHPEGHQTLGVSLARSGTTTTGFTGSRGRSIMAVLGGGATSTAFDFMAYGSQTVPTSLLLPCSGTGSVVFLPRPASKTARSATVTVSFVNLALTPGAKRSTSPLPSHTITVTLADSGRRLTLQQGDRLNVRLAGPSAYTWTEPTSSAPAVLERRGGSSGSQASAVFLAVGAGKATVSATDNPNCYPRCLAPSRLFEVSVSVR
jgi:hypothetical protein